MKRLTRERIDLKKVSGFAIFINGLQIVAALLVAILSIFFGENMFRGAVEQAALSGMALVVVWGAVLDIRDARTARRIGDESDMLEEAIVMLNDLNGTLRAQRHDFMNQLQVVYSLMEMNEYGDAQEYIEKVYGDIQKVQSALKTSIPAVNALLASKLADCEERGIEMQIKVGSPWASMPIPDWELCRVLSNLIDNAMDAVRDASVPRIWVETGETLHDLSFRISNNGPRIPDSVREQIFQQGFSTKGSGRGMGLLIVRGILQDHGGRLELESGEVETKFEGIIPKQLGQQDRI